MAAEEKWYFTKEQLSNSPSRKCGLDADKELSYRQQAANFIQDMGQKLQVTQLCINTAIVYMHRFYVFHSFTHFNRNAMAAAALFLAAKVEEQPRKLEHVIRIAHACLHRDQPHLDTKSEQYLEQAQDLVFNENVLLQTLGFDVAIDHPHTHVVRCSQLVRASKDLAQTSYIMASNSLHLTTMCLQYKPTFVACLCIYLACKWAGLEIPQSNEGKDWFWYVDKTVTLEQLEQVTSEFLTIFDKCPTKLKKKIMSITASQTLVGQSLTPAGSPFDKEPRKVSTSLDFHARHPPPPTLDSKSGPLRPIPGNADEAHKKPQQPVRHPPDPSQTQRIDYREKKDKIAASTTARESHHSHSGTSSSHHKAHPPLTVPSNKVSTGHHRPGSNNSINVPRDARREQVHIRDSGKREIVSRSSDQLPFVPSANVKQEPRVSGVEVTSDSGTSIGNLINTNVPCNSSVSIKKDISVSEWKNDSDIKPDKTINRIPHSESSRHKLINEQNRVSVNSDNRAKDHTDQRQPYIHRPDRQKHRDVYPPAVDMADRKLVDPSFDRHEIAKKQSNQVVSGHSLPVKREVKQEKLEENIEYKSHINQTSSNIVKRETVQEKIDEVTEQMSQVNRTSKNNISSLNLHTNKIRSKSPASLGTSLSTSSSTNINMKKSPNSVSVSKSSIVHHRSSPYNLTNESGLAPYVTASAVANVSEDKQHSSHFKVVKKSDSNENHSRKSDLESNPHQSKVGTHGSHKIFTSTPEKHSSTTSVRESPYQRNSKPKQRTPPSSRKNISTDITPLPVSGFSSPSSVLQPPSLSTPGKSGIPTTPSNMKSSRHRTSSSGSEPELVPVATKISDTMYKNIMRGERIIIRDEIHENRDERNMTRDERSSIRDERNTIRDEKIKIPGRVPDIIPPIRDRKKEESISGSSSNKVVASVMKDMKPVEICRPFVQQSVEQVYSDKSSSEVTNIGMITVESEVISSERQSVDLNTSTESVIDVTSVPETADLSLPLITISTSSNILRSESPKRDHHHKSEKKKKKEKHKHKEKDKNKDREDREKRHKDKHKPKHKDKDKDRDKEKEHHRSEKYGEAVPSSAPIKITIPKDKLNLSQTLEVGSTSSSSTSGLKLKIQKDRLIGSDSTGNSPQMMASGSLKIKISKDAIGGFSNSQSSSSESRKRDRSPSAPADNSPATKITKLDVPMTKKVEGSRSKSSHSKTNGVEYSSASLTPSTSVPSRGRSSQHYTGSSKVRGVRGRGRPPLRGLRYMHGGGVGAELGGPNSMQAMSFNYPPPYFQTYPPPSMIPQHYNMYSADQMYHTSDQNQMYPISDQNQIYPTSDQNQMYSTSDQNQMYTTDQNSIYPATDQLYSSSDQMYGYYTSALQQDMSQYMFQSSVDQQHDQLPPLPKDPPPGNIPPPLPRDHFFPPPPPPPPE